MKPEQSPWRLEALTPSLPEVHRSLTVPKTASFWRNMPAFAGPGFLVAVGYMDPRNWATDFPQDRDSTTRCCSSSCFRT